MPAPAHARFIFSGVFGTVAAPFEEWSFSLAITDPAPSLLEGDLKALATAGSNSYQHIASGIHAGAVLTNVRCAAIADTGKYARDPFGKYLMGDQATGQAGTAGAGIPHPTQISLAVTLETGYPGALGRGRFYVPAPLTGTLEADGTISTLVRDAWAQRVKNFIESLNTGVAAVQADSRVAVASGGSALKGVAGAVRPVTSVRVGRRLDIQRRRAGDIPEQYATAAIA